MAPPRSESWESGSAPEVEGKPLAGLMRQVLGDKAEQESDGKYVKLVLAILAREVAQLRAQLAMSIKAESGEGMQEGIDNPVRMKMKAEIG